MNPVSRRRFLADLGFAGGALALVAGLFYTTKASAASEASPAPATKTASPAPKADPTPQGQHSQAKPSPDPRMRHFPGEMPIQRPKRQSSGRPSPTGGPR